MTGLGTAIRLLTLACGAQMTALAQPAPGALSKDLPAAAASSSWSDADYARFTPETFRQHPPAQRVLDRATLDYELLSAALHYATNAERTKKGLAPLAYSRGLRDAAFEHSRDMAVADFFSHDNPKDSAKRTPWQRMAAKGVAGGYRAENIAKNTAAGSTYLSVADALVKQWMNSPGHRANILNPKLTRLGCGAHACRCPKFHLLATQNFASAGP